MSRKGPIKIFGMFSLAGILKIADAVGRPGLAKKNEGGGGNNLRGSKVYPI